MIELNLKLSPDTANHLLASLAGTINALGLLSQEIKRQGDAQMQPAPAPEPAPEPEQEVLDKDQ
mgnify:CR=1 FL=1